MTLDSIIKKPIRKLVLTAAVLTALAGIGRAATIDAKATDLNTGAPVQGVLYKFIGPITDSARTDSNGNIPTKVLPDGIYQILIGDKSEYISFNVNSDTLNGTVRRNVAMIPKQQIRNGTGGTGTDTVNVTSAHYVDLFDLNGIIGGKFNPYIFNVSDPLNPRIKYEYSTTDTFTPEQKTAINNQINYLNNYFGREWMIESDVNNDGITVHKAGSYYTTRTISGGDITAADAYDADTIMTKVLHEFGHCNGALHAGFGMMQSSGLVMPQPIDAVLFNSTYDYISAFRNGRTDIYLACASDTSGFAGVAGQPISITPRYSEIKAKNGPNPFRNNTTIRYTVPKNGKVTLEVFNILGQQVEKKELQAHQGENMYDFSNPTTSGTLIYRISDENTSVTNKMLQIR